MCMIEHIPELMESGIDSFKIEGRMKSAYYTAVTANTYRMAIDRYLAEPAAYRFDPIWKTELESVSHRDYCTGYYFDDPMKNAQTVENAGYVREKLISASWKLSILSPAGLLLSSVIKSPPEKLPS